MHTCTSITATTSPSLVSVKAAVVCMPSGNSEVLLAVLYTSLGDADIIHFLSIRYVIGR
jgi:hypothetical protein